MNIVILNFSPRSNGNCAAVCHMIENYYANSNIRSFHVCEHISPCNHCDYQCLKPEKRCPNLTREYTGLMNTICESDLTYYVVPNFCGMPNAVYYAFNERTVGYFNMDHALMEKYMTVRKRFIVISNTESNTFRETMQQQTTEAPEILYLKTSRYQKKSIDGDMMESAAAQTDLIDFLIQGGQIGS